MKSFLWLLFLSSFFMIALAACASWRGERPGEVEEKKERGPAEPAECPPERPLQAPQVIKIPCPPERPLCPPSPPAPPSISWTQPGCPVRKFGACLSREDLKELIEFLKADQTWRESILSGCNHGR